MSIFLTVFLIIIGLAAVAAWVWSNEEHDHFNYEDENFLIDQDINDNDPRFL